MDPTRISVARLLAQGTLLTWQEAVAVVQEVAMVSDVNAAMNSSPSLVSPETCFITTAGEVELPETTASDMPSSVVDLLRTVLQGREAPDALLALARRRNADDLFGELAAFSAGPRRPVIAALAARALAPSPTASESDVAEPSLARSAPSLSRPPVLFPASAAEPLAAPTPPPLPTSAPPVPSPRLVHRVEQRRPAEKLPPFVASPHVDAAVTKAPPFRADEAPLARDANAEIELQRLRARTLDRTQRAHRFAAWLSWRPSFLDPRLVGGAVILLAAALGIWTGSLPRTAAPVAVSPPPVTPPAPAASPLGASSSPTPPTADAPAAAPGPTPRPGTGRVSAGRPAASNAPPVTPTMPPRPTPVPEPRGSADAGVSAAPPAPIVLPPASPSNEPTSAVPLPEGARPKPRATREVARSRVPFYTATDTNVTPPVMLRQQLPSPLLEPGAELQPGGPYLELLIDEQGAVEQVRLRARQPLPGQTWYRHRMLLAAAKAWQFEPARLDQQTVRYLMRVPLEP